MRLTQHLGSSFPPQTPSGTPLRPKCATQSHSPFPCLFHSRQVTDSRSWPSGRPITFPTFHTRAIPASSSTSAETSVTVRSCQFAPLYIAVTGVEVPFIRKSVWKYSRFMSSTKASYPVDEKVASRCFCMRCSGAEGGGERGALRNWMN